jgi:hypothetical protein
MPSKVASGRRSRSATAEPPRKQKLNDVIALRHAREMERREVVRGDQIKIEFLN